MSLGLFYLTLIAMVLLPFVPFIVYNYKEVRCSWKQAIIYGILTIMINFLISKLINLKLMYLLIFTFIPSILGTVFNILITKDGVDLKKLPKTVIIFSIFMFSSLFQLLIIPFLNYDLNNLTATQELVLATFSDSVLLIILAIIYRKTLIDNLKKLKGTFNSIIDVAIKYWLVGLLVMVGTNLLIGTFTKARAVNEESVQEIIHGAKYLSIITIGIIAPITEELVFRKSFRDLFKNDLVFILASGLIFGGLHVFLSLSGPSDILYLIPYSSLGIAFAAMYVKTDNIYASTFMHIFHNTVFTIISLL